MDVGLQLFTKPTDIQILNACRQHLQVTFVEFSRLGLPKRYEYTCEVFHKLSKSKTLSSAQSLSNPNKASR